MSHKDQGSKSSSRSKLALSIMSSRQLSDLFGTTGKPKRHSGRAENGEQVNSWTSSYDQTANVLTIVNAKGSKITGSPAEVECFLAGVTPQQS